MPRELRDAPRPEVVVAHVQRGKPGERRRRCRGGEQKARSFGTKKITAEVQGFNASATGTLLLRMLVIMPAKSRLECQTNGIPDRPAPSEKHRDLGE